MSVLIDTSVWIDHFRNANPALVELIGFDYALTHPMVALELACGTLPAPRVQTLDNIGLLRTCNQTSFKEISDFIEREKLYGFGCGVIDIALLSSTLITQGTLLWTFDKRLNELAIRFGVAYVPPGFKNLQSNPSAQTL